MKLTYSDSPPRMLGTHEAAAMLVGQAHLTLCLHFKAAGHTHLAAELNEQLAGALAWYSIAIRIAENLPHPLVDEGPDPSCHHAERGCLVGFIPDNPINRLILLAVIASYCGAEAVRQIIRQPPSSGSPILMLAETTEQERDFETVLATLDALTRKEAVVLNGN